MGTCVSTSYTSGVSVFVSTVLCCALYFLSRLNAAVCCSFSAFSTRIDNSEKGIYTTIYSHQEVE